MLSTLLKKYPTSLPISFLVLVILVPHWKLATMSGFVITDDIFTSDLMNDAFPYRFYLSEVLKSGQLPLWYPPVYGGFPLLARAEAGIAYPLNFLLFGLFPPYTALNLVVLFTLIIAAVGMYLYAREIQIDIVGALVAAVSFSYSGFMVAHLKHLSTVNTACWFPLGLYFIERAFRQNEGQTFLQKAKPFVYLSFVIGVQNLAGHTQTAYYCGLVYAAYFLFRYFVGRKVHEGGKKKRTDQNVVPSVSFFQNPVTLWFVAAIVIAGGISAVQLLPTYELVSLSQRSGGVTFEYAANYAYDPSNIKTFLYPYANGDIGNATYSGKSIFWEDYGYVGLITTLFALYAGAALWKKKPHTKFFAVAAVVAYILALGPNTPVYEAVFHVFPGMKFFRFPTRFLLIVDASLAILGALGVSHLLSRRGNKTKVESDTVSPVGYAVLALVVLDLLYFQMRQNPIVDAHAWLTPPKTVQKIKGDPEVFRIYSPGASETHKAAFSMAQGWQGSLQPYLDQREFIQPSLNVLYGLSTADGYAQLTPNYVVDVWGDQNRGGWIYETATLQQNAFVPRQAFFKIISVFNIKYLLTPWPVQSDSLERMESPAGVFMYRNPHVMARAFMVSNYRLAQSQEEAKSILLSNEFDPKREAILYKRPQHTLSDGQITADIVIVRYRANEVVIRVKTDRAGLLVLSDTYYPGWKAFVDGEEKEVLQANICQRAVEVAFGEHEVRFVFDSLPVKAGFSISIAALLIAGGLLVAARRKG
jgi:hypothetical protein